MRPETGETWMGVTVNTDVSEARRRFETRFGEPPEHVITTGGGILVGPIPRPVPEGEASRAAGEGLGQLGLFEAGR